MRNYVNEWIETKKSMWPNNYGKFCIEILIWIHTCFTLLFLILLSSRNIHTFWAHVHIFRKKTRQNNDRCFFFHFDLVREHTSFQYFRIAFIISSKASEKIEILMRFWKNVWITRQILHRPQCDDMNPYNLFNMRLKIQRATTTTKKSTKQFKMVNFLVDICCWIVTDEAVFNLDRMEAGFQCSVCVYGW